MDRGDGSARAGGGVLVRALREAAAFDRSALAPWPALRAALGIVAMLSIGLGLSDPAAAAAMGAGALLAGFPSIAGGPRPPLVAMTGVVLAMASATFVGSVTGHIGWLHLALVAPFAFAGGMLVALGPVASSIGLQAVMAMIVFGRFAADPAGALKLAGFVAAGGAAQIALAAFLRPPHTPGTKRRALGAAYRALAELAAGSSGVVGGHAARGQPPDAVSGLFSAEALDEAATALDEPILLGRVEVGPLRSLLDVGRRIRLDLLAVHGLADQLGRQAGGPGPLGAVALRQLHDAKELLDAIASVLAGGEGDLATDVGSLATSSTLRKVVSPTERDEARHGPSSVADAVAGTLVDRLAALGGQLRAAAGLATRAADVRALPALTTAALVSSIHPLAGARAAAELLGANLSLESPSLRHALRMATLLPLAEVLAQHIPLQRGYWIALTAGVVLRPDFSSTFARGVARVLGTLVGVGLAGLLAVGLHPSGAAVVVAIGAFAWATYAILWVNYAAFSCLLTGLVVLLLSIVTPDSLGTAADRLGATLLGGALALGAYALWPTWSRNEAGTAVEDLVASQRAYLAAVLASATGRAPLEANVLRAAARHARLARSAAEAAVDRSLAEPARHRIDAATTSGALAALRRIALATHSLRLALVASGPLVTGPPADALVEAMDTALSLVGATIRAGVAGEGATGASGVRLPPLRLAHRRLLEADLSGMGDDTFLAVTDELVDAIDTLAVTLDLGIAEPAAL